MAAVLTVPICARCSSRAVASGLDARGRRVLVCSACGERRIYEPDTPRSAPVPDEPPYWAR